MEENRKKTPDAPEQIAVRERAREALGRAPEVAFDFNLDFDNRPVFGACAADSIEIVFASGGDVHKYALSELDGVRLFRGVGTVAIESTVDGEEIELCRADMQLCRTFEDMVAQLEARRTGRPIGKPKEDRCPKCGRRFPRGSEVCVHCADKKKLLGRFVSFARADLKLLLLGGVFLLLTSGVSVIVPRGQRRLIDGFLAPAVGVTPGTRGGLAAVVGLLALCGFSVALFDCLRRVFTAKASARIIVRIRKQLFEKVQSLSLTGLSRRSPGELITRLSEDTEQLRNFLTNLVPQLLQQTVTLLAIIILLLYRNWFLTLMIVLPVPLLVLLFASVNKLTRRIYRRQWQLSSDINNLLHDVFSGIREVKVFGTEEREYKRFQQRARRFADTSKRNEMIWNLVVPFSSFLLGTGEFLVLLVIGGKVINGQATAGELTEFLAYVATLYGPIRWFTHVPRMLTQSMTSMSKVSEMLDEQEIMPDGTEQSAELRGEIVFKDASFGYNPPDYVLKHLSLEIQPGDFIGLVGRSGVGKTTVINLMMRMYDLNEGQLLIDGKDVREYAAAAFRSQIGVVLQETYLFNGTIYSNLAYAKPEASREEVLRAAKLAGAHSFIMRLPDGYNTYVGARGNTLSGGEKQRIAIARAILRNPRLLILDEATSSLDTETEKQIQDALFALSKGRTTVAIAHRLSTLRNATKLAVFEKGELEELGTHDELMQKEGRYYRLVMAQREMSKMQK